MRIKCLAQGHSFDPQRAGAPFCDVICIWSIIIYLSAVMVFIDFRKAFDSVDRDTLMKILLAYGIPKKIVDLISLLYTNTSAQVITPDGKTEFFEIQAGVLQGDTLAPYLFVIVMDYCMRLALEKHPDLASP